MIVESYEDVVILTGALRQNFWETIHTAISLALKRRPTGVIIDCSGLTEVTASGAETFRSAMEFIKKHDARVIVTGVTPQVMDVLKTVSDVRSQLPIAKNLDEARRSLYVMGDDEEQGKSKKKRSHISSSGVKVLVCLTDSGSDPFGLRVATSYVHALEADAVCVYPIVVPRDLPMDAPLPELEDAARKALENAERICEAAQVPCTVKVGRGRDLASALVESLEEVPARQLIVPLPNDPNAVDGAEKTVRAVLSKINLPVLFVRDRIG